jgi:predicted transcriptional regulator
MRQSIKPIWQILLQFGICHGLTNCMNELKELKELQAALKAAGLNQAWAAKRLGITPGYITMIKREGLTPSASVLRRMNELTSRLEKSGLTKAVS